MNYLLESTVCITIFYGLYYLIFRRLTFVILNRIYLLSSLVVGLSLPLISYQIKEVVRIPARVEYEETTSMPLLMNSSTPLLSNISTEEPFEWSFVLQGIYILGIILMSLKLMYSLRIIAKELILKSSNHINHSSDNFYISTQSNYANSSFFNLIFIDDSNLSENEINQILEHEKWHIRLFHSYDLLFVEILKIAFWFNPILWLYQRSLSEVHEYEVDTRMIQKYNPQNYAQLLLKLATTTPQLATTHQFSRKPLTDRIHFLFIKQKSVPMKRLAYLSVLPILGAFFMAFSVEKVVDYQEVEESSKYFKIERNLDYDGFPDLSVKENKVVSTLYLNKGKIAFVINPDKVSEETVNNAAKYFKDYGFTLKILNKELDATKKELAKLEISLTEDENNKKQRLKNKVSAKTNLPEKFNFDLVKMRTKSGKGLDTIITILAVKTSGLHFVSPLAPPPPPPPPLPPLPPKAPKKMPPPPPVPPLPPVKVDFGKNLFRDSIKLIGEGFLGKNPLVIIDGKKYPPNVLYKLNRDKIKGTALYSKNNLKRIIKELGENNIDGAVVLETREENELFLAGKELEISIENETKRQNIKNNKPVVSRVTLIDKDGKKYDEVTVYREDGSKRASVNVQIRGKVLFLVKGEPKTEEELKKINPKTLGNSVWTSNEKNEYYIKKFPKIGKNTLATIAFNE